MILISPHSSLTCHCWIITRSLQAEITSLAAFCCPTAFSFEPAGPSGVTTHFLSRPRTGLERDLSLFAGSFVLTFLQMATMDRQSGKQTKQYFLYKYCPDPPPHTCSSSEACISPTHQPIRTLEPTPNVPMTYF